MYPIRLFLLLFMMIGLAGTEAAAASSNSNLDSLVPCDWLCFLSEWNLKPYTLDPVNLTLTGGKPWGAPWTSGSNIVALLRHPQDLESLRLYGFSEGWIGYTAGENGSPGPLLGTGHYLPGTYRYIVGSDSFAFLHSISLNLVVHSLYGYTLTSPPELLRNDLDLSLPHIATDQYHRAYVAIREPGTNFSTQSILVLDSLGHGRWEFDFAPALSAYNATGMAVIGNGLYMSFGSLHPEYPYKIVRFELDCSSGQAFPTDIMPWPGTSFSGMTSGKPGDPLGNCPPNTDQPPMILTGVSPAIQEPLVEVSPNPVSSTLFIRSASPRECSARLVHLSGTNVWNGCFQGELELPVIGLPPGVYLLQVSSDDRTFMSRILKQ